MKLHYFTCGDGFPLVILHGLFGSSDNWQALSKKFSEHFSVYAVDLRNHGASPHDATFDYPVMAADLLEFMENHGISEAHLLGHSMGGKVAMEFVSQWPERVRKLVVADIAPKGYPPHHHDLIEALWSLDLKTVATRSEIDSALAAKIPDASVRSFLLKSVGRDDNGGFKWKINLQAIREQYPKIASALDLKRPFVGPTLFIRGSTSDYIAPGDEVLIRKSFPAAEFATLEGAGHWLHAEKPGEFYTRVMEFLG